MAPLPPSVRVNVNTPFPALIQGSGPVTIGKQNGIWTVGFSFGTLGVEIPPAQNYSTDYLLAYDSFANVFFKVPFNGVALPSGLLEFSANVNFNAANTDTQIPIQLPPGFTRYWVNGVTISGASQTLTTATAGLFTGAGGTGTAIVTGASAITVSSAADNTNNNMQSMTVNNSGSQSYALANEGTLFFRVGTAEGAPATGNVSVYIRPIP